MIKYEAIKKVVEGEKARQEKKKKQLAIIPVLTASSQSIISCFGSQGNLLCYFNSLLIESIHLFTCKKIKQP